MSSKTILILTRCKQQRILEIRVQTIRVSLTTYRPFTQSLLLLCARMLLLCARMGWLTILSHETPELVALWSLRDKHLVNTRLSLICYFSPGYDICCIHLYLLYTYIIRKKLQTTLKDASPTFLPWVWRAGESMRILFKFIFTLIKATTSPHHQLDQGDQVNCPTRWSLLLLIGYWCRSYIFHNQEKYSTAMC